MTWQICTFALTSSIGASNEMHLYDQNWQKFSMNVPLVNNHRFVTIPRYVTSNQAQVRILAIRQKQSLLGN